MNGKNLQFKLNKEQWEHLVALRNWKHPITRLAYLTGFTKSYISQVVNGGIPCSHDFMLAVVEVSGNSQKEPAEWASLFDIVKISARGNGSYQLLNQKKYKGMVSYKKNSLLGKMRKEDKARDLERLDADKPVPASDFYQDHELVPAKVYYGNRYAR